MNSIGDMPPEEANGGPSLEGDAAHGGINPTVQDVQMHSLREVPKQRRRDGVASGLRHVQEHETVAIGSCFGAWIRTIPRRQTHHTCQTMHGSAARARGA
jgi:hypothetical protein